MEKLYSILLEYYDNSAENLRADFESVGGYAMASGGCFAVYYNDQKKKELAQCGYIVEGLDDEEIFKTYCNNVAKILEENLG